MIYKRPEDFIADIEGRINKLESEVESIQASGGIITKDPTMLITETSPMYKNEEYAKKVLENSDIAYIEQYLKNIITKALQ